MRNPGDNDSYKTKTERVLVIACGNVVANGMELIFFFSRIATNISLCVFKNLDYF